MNNEWSGDVLHRKKYSTFLTEYLKEKSEGHVININAPWGSGKTFFVRNWMNDMSGIHPTVYFNAWENDYNSDPLISIVSCINNTIIPLLPDNGKKIHSKKIFLTKSGMMLKQLAPIAFRAGLRKLVGEGGLDDLSKINSETEGSIIELSSKVADLLTSHDQISSSIDDFKNSIKLILKEITTDEALTLPLFVFIDELDRCRPSYSIELLERIKHIFDIPGVVFIVSTDTQQLSQSVKAIYGEKFNGEIYLRRFFDQIYTLPEPSCIDFTQLLFKEFTPKAKYFSYCINTQAESSYTLTCPQTAYSENVLLFSLFAIFFKLDLRSKNQCFERFIAIEKSLSENEELHFGYLIFLIMLDAKFPDKFQRFFSVSKSQDRNEIVAKLGDDDRKNISVYSNECTAKHLISKYTYYTCFSQRDLRNRVNSFTDNGFEYYLALSLNNNFKFLLKYKERVEMVEALS